MFKELFLDARDYLNQRGFKATLIMGVPVTEAEISAVDSLTDFPMPLELKRFYSELGDGFEFRVEGRDNDCDMVGWEPGRLSDYCVCNSGFASAIDEDVAFVVNQPKCRVETPALLKAAEERKNWIPFYGLSGDGSFLCIDRKSFAIKYYDPSTWASCPETWGFVLATSLMDFVERWSEFNFVSPGGRWTSFCMGRSGMFDWASDHFPRLRGSGK